MRSFLVGFLGTLVGFSVLPASAQIVVQPNGVFQNPLALVEHKDIQKELNLSSAQVGKIAELSRKHLEAVKGLGFQEIEKRKKVIESTQKELGELLTAEQGKRLKQFELQQRGANVFLDPQVSRDLAISQEQRTAILKTLQGFGPRWVAIIQSAKGNQVEIQKKVAELNRDLTAQIVKGLTDDQQIKWRELTGRQFMGTFPSFVPVFVANPRPQPVLSWHMNDLAAAQAEARKTGKPIFTTFRCEA